MNYSLLERALVFLKAQRKKKIWYRLMTCMAAVVVFITTYMLILPAITMEREVYCGLKEHVHAEACYDEAENLICGSDQHIHNENCYLAEDTGYSDYSTGEDDAVIDNTSDEIFYDPDYVTINLGSPYGADEEPAAGETESETESQIEKESETESETVEYSCGHDAHAHTDECFDADGTRVCGKEEHIHNEECLLDAEVETETANESETEIRTETESEPAVETGTETESESETEPETETESEPETETGKKTETVSEPETERETKHVTEAETESESAAETESEIESEIITEPVGEAETEVEPETEATADEYSASAVANAQGEATETFAIRRMARSASYDSLDMTDYITGASFGGTEIEAGKSVSVLIGYQIYSNVLKSAGTNELTYQLPEGIIPNADYEGEVYDNNGKAVGTYTISRSGEICIVLNQDFIDSGNIIIGSISFWSKLSEEGTEEGEEKVYSFSETNHVDAVIVIKKKQQDESESEGSEHDIHADKRYTYDAENKSAIYTITIGTDAGTGGGIQITDTMDLPSGVTGTVDMQGLTITGPGGNYDFTEYFAIDTATGKITTKEGKRLPDLTEGQSYVITYKVNYAGLETQNQSIELKNTAVVEDLYKQIWASTSIKLNHTYITKSGYYDSGKDKITWTITLNDFGGNLEGYTLTDLLKKSGEQINLPSEVTMTEYKSDGSNVTHNITIDADGGYTFSSGEGYDTTSKFVITYETDVSEDGFYSAYENQANLAGGGNSFTADPGVIPVTHYKGVIDKNYIAPTSTNGIVETVEGDDGLRCYTWNVTIVPPKGGIKEGAVYTDVISTEGSSEKAHYITAEQLKNLEIKKGFGSYGQTESLSIDAYELRVKVNGEWVKFETQEGPFTEFRLYFLKDLSEEECNKIILNNYQTTADLSKMKNGNTWTFKNEGSFEQDGGKATDFDAKKEAKGGYLKKLDIGGSSGNYAYDECKGVMYYCLKINETGTAITKDAGTIVVTDTLPEGTTLYSQAYNIADFGYGVVYQSGNNTDDNINDKKIKFYLCNATNMNTQLYEAANLDEALSDGTTGYVDINDIASWDYNSMTRQITMTIPSEFLKLSRAQSVVVFYAAQITDALAKQETKTYTNEAHLSINGEEKATDSVTNTVTSSYLSKALNPDVNTSDLKSNEVAYRVLINPTGATLNAGNSVTLVDSITYGEYLKGVSLKAGSLHLYNVTASGIKGSEVDTSLYTVVYGDKEEDGTKRYEVELTLMDSTPYILEYVYAFSIDELGYQGSLGGGTQDVTYTVSNDITFKGRHTVNDSSSTDEELLIKGSGATVSTDKLILSKVDGDNQVVYLEGAVFELQQYIGETTETDWTRDNLWEKVDTYETGEDGTISLGALKYNVAYRLVEMEAPTNYVLDSAPHYFYLYSSKATVAYPDGFAETAQNAVGNIIITNQKAETDYTYISISKIWRDSKGNEIISNADCSDSITDNNGNVITEIQVQLYQTTEAGATDGGTEYENGLITLTPDEDGNWHHVYNNLPRDNGKDKTDTDYERYYYYVKEVGAVIEDGSTIELTDSFTTTLDREGAVTGGHVTMTNTKLPAKTSISVTKIWDDENNADGSRPSEIPVTLYRSESGEIPETEPPETEPPETEAVQEYNVTVEFYINDVYKGEISGTDKIKSTGGTVTVKDLYGYDKFSSITGTMGGQTISVDDVEYNTEKYEAWGWTYDSKLAICRFPQVSGDIILKVTVSAGHTWGTDYAVVVTDSSSETSDTPSDETESKLPLTLPVDKEEVETIKLGSSHASEGGYSNGGWTYTWNDLPDDQYYYVLENGALTKIPGYDAAYQYDYDENDEKRVLDVRITNVPDGSKVISVTVNKKWVGYTSSIYEDYEVSVQLKKNGENYGEPITLTKANATTDDGASWSYTWNGLEQGKYTVEELRVVDILSKQEITNYIVSNSCESDEITITNTSKTEGYTLPETGGTGTKPYTLGGAMLTVIAAFLMYIQNKRRKEEQDSS